MNWNDEDLYTTPLPGVQPLACVYCPEGSPRVYYVGALCGKHREEEWVAEQSRRCWVVPFYDKDDQFLYTKNIYTADLHPTHLVQELSPPVDVENPFANALSRRLIARIFYLQTWRVGSSRHTAVIYSEKRLR